MKNRRFFGMVSTAASSAYTAKAVESFLACTKLRPEDRFVLFDNDRSLENNFASRFPQVEVSTNDTPRSFAANVNALLSEARAARADVYFLNNDLIFTSGWLEPLVSSLRGLVSPCSNREFPYLKDRFRAERTLELADYVGHERELETIARVHRSRHQGYRSVLTLPFFCIKLPFEAYSQLGDLDESFGRGGAEDNDYTLRAHLAGIPVTYALQSYVLHFNGKSTWNGAENADESRAREEKYLDVFKKKWGEDLTELSILGKREPIDKSAAASEAARRGDLRGVVEALRSAGEKSG